MKTFIFIIITIIVVAVMFFATWYLEVYINEYFVHRNKRGFWEILADEIEAKARHDAKRKNKEGTKTWKKKYLKEIRKRLKQRSRKYTERTR